MLPGNPAVFLCSFSCPPRGLSHTFFQLPSHLLLWPYFLFHRENKLLALTTISTPPTGVSAVFPCRVSIGLRCPLPARATASLCTGFYSCFLRQEHCSSLPSPLPPKCCFSSGTFHQHTNCWCFFHVENRNNKFS